MSLCLSLSLLKSSKFTLSLQNLHLRPRMSAVLSAQNTSVQARSTLAIYKNATSCIHVWRFRPGGRINSNSNISDRTYVKFVKPRTMCDCLKIRGKRQMWERAFCACRRFLVLSTQNNRRFPCVEVLCLASKHLIFQYLKTVLYKRSNRLSMCASLKTTARRSDVRASLVFLLKSTR
jgi:hypothetical protein